MATKNISVSVAVLNVLNVCGKAIETLALVIAATIFVVCMTIFWFNPVIFIPACLIAPRQAASSLYKLDIPFYNFWQAVYGWWVALLPMWWKKHFIQARGVGDYPPSVQVKYFFTGLEASEKVIKNMTSEGMDMLWQADNGVRLLLVQNGYQPSADQLDQLDSVMLSHVVQALPHHRTVSNDILSLLLDRKVTDKFLAFVANNGLSSKMIYKVFNSNDAKLMEDTREALECFSEKQTVRRTQTGGTYGGADTEEWQLFLDEKKGKRLCLAAECEMSTWQYEYFHRAGFSLSEEGICSFLAGGDAAMCRLVLQNEPEKSFNAKAQALIAANPKLKRLQLTAKKSR